MTKLLKKLIQARASLQNSKANNVVKQVGFTLIELSIVLVIIGLIVGGVLVGQDLIKAAEIRATVSQYEKYNAAINTFRTKYNGIPGDLAAASSTAFGLDPTGTGAGAHAGTAGLGDGNGLIDGVGGAAANEGLQWGEALFFWQQLSSASLVDGSFGQNTTTAGKTAADLTASTINTYLPAAKMGRGNSWGVGTDSAGQNYYVLGSLTAVTAASGVPAYSVSITPVESFNIDTKLDDGQPNTGIVQARNATYVTGPGPFGALSTNNASVSHASGSEAAGDCQVGATSTTTSNTYSRGTAAGTTPGCILRLRFN